MCRLFKGGLDGRGVEAQVHRDVVHADGLQLLQAPCQPAASRLHLAWTDSGTPRLVSANGHTAELDLAQMRCRAIFDDCASLRATTLAKMGLSVNPVWSVAREIAAGRLVHGFHRVGSC
ncbi:MULTISPECIES: hypothetical protein [Marinovum]|uniref:hypothetical protein n=1 Tax=Marinovum TaxID=367771 RepID=UPI00237C1F7F|nr:hypothetical protein [Marinovum sp. PR37]MDD9745277.1 hypothetical protein [Marinovum sp. PR37]